MCLFQGKFCPDVCSRVGLRGYRVVLGIDVKGTSMWFSIVAVPAYIPTNRAGGFPFLHSPSSTCDLWTDE